MVLSGKTVPLNDVLLTETTLITREQNSDDGLSQLNALTDENPPTKVLILENHVEQSNLMRHGLQFDKSGYDAEFATSLNEARERIHNDPPDILISEISFPDGFVGELLSADPELATFPIVVFTDRGSEKEAVDLLKAGVLDYVVKTRRKCQEIGDLIKKSLVSWSKIKSARQAEINLQQTLRLASSIMNSLPTPMGVLDEYGMLLSVNDAWSLNELNHPLIGEGCKPNCDYLFVCRNTDHEIGETIAREIELALQSQTKIATTTYPIAPNEMIWFSSEIHPCTGSGRARAIIVHQNVTERKMLEQGTCDKEIATETIKRLTNRERQVMGLVVSGKPNKSIARILNISVKTVEMHRSNLMKKLKLRSVTDLVRLAINAGIEIEESQEEPSIGEVSNAS